MHDVEITTNSPISCIELNMAYIYMFLYEIAWKLFYNQLLHKHDNVHYKIMSGNRFHLNSLILSHQYMSILANSRIVHQTN
jgi:hypothetical protein